jgi:hypothetical protein
LPQVVIGKPLQNFVYKHIADSKNVQRNKKNEKGEFKGCQVLGSIIAP